MDTKEKPLRKPYAPPTIIVSEVRGSALTTKSVPSSPDHLNGPTQHLGDPS